MADLKISPAVRAVLRECLTITDVAKGKTAQALKLPPARLDPKLYTEVKKAIELLGGKYVTGRQIFRFETGNPAELLRVVLRSGIIVDTQKKFQAFYTPPELADKVAQWADVKDLCVLEPSAGHGALAKACFQAGAAKVDCLELNPDNEDALKQVLGADGKVIIDDFLSCDPVAKSIHRINCRYQRIVMNPPFTKGQDLAHVNHALDWLAPDGILVAIMLDDDFRDGYQKLVKRVNDLCAMVITESIPAKTFADTAIKTRLFKVCYPSAECKAAKAKAARKSTTSVSLSAGGEGRGEVAEILQEPEFYLAKLEETNAAIRATTKELRDLLAESLSSGPLPDNQTETNQSSRLPMAVTQSQMKITIPRIHLLTALAAVRSAANPKADPAILANVLISATDGKTVHLTTLNNTLSLKTQVIGADVNIKGETTVPAVLLHEIVRTLTCDRVTLTVQEDTTVKVIAGDGEYVLATFPAAEFPAMPEVVDPQEFEIVEHELQGLLARTGFARGTDEKRLILTSSLIRLNGDTFVAACDGKRLAVEQGAPTSLVADLNLPPNAVGELLRLLGTDPKKARSVKVRFNALQAQFSFGQHNVLTQLIGGLYPDYTKIVPEMDDDHIVTVGRAELLAAAKRAALLADGIRLEFKKKSLHISTHHTGAAVIGKSVESQLTTGTTEATVNLPVKLLVEALEAVESEEVNLYPATDKPLALHEPTSTWVAVISAIK